MTPCPFQRVHCRLFFLAVVCSASVAWAEDDTRPCPVTAADRAQPETNADGAKPAEAVDEQERTGAPALHAQPRITASSAGATLSVADLPAVKDLDPLSLFTMSAGALSLGAAAGVSWALHQEDEEAALRSNSPDVQDERALQQRERKQLLARSLAAIGSGLALTGGVLWYLGEKERDATKLGARCNPRGCALLTSGTF
jgi:hypothetical protein